jgi:hypothetical protein
MSNYTFSLECLEITANILAINVDRNNIFPPLLNDPKSIISQNKRPFHQRKRLPNAFFVCRINVQKEVARNGFNSNMRIVSKAASILWNSASSEEKYQYVLIANNIKVYHSRIIHANIENSDNNYNYNPYISFPLCSQSQKTEQETSKILSSQTLHSRSMQSNIENSSNPYYYFPLSLQSPNIKTEQEISEIIYFQTLHYDNDHIILHNYGNYL